VREAVLEEMLADPPVHSASPLLQALDQLSLLERKEHSEKAKARSRPIPKERMVFRFDQSGRHNLRVLSLDQQHSMQTLPWRVLWRLGKGQWQQLQAPTCRHVWEGDNAVPVVPASGAAGGRHTDSVASAPSMDAALAHLLANPALWEGDLASLEDEAEE
jgi:hypothetical protein